MKAVTARIFKQKQVTFYYFTMNARELEPLCFVEAAARDRQKGLQRVTAVARLKEIGEFLARGASSLLPNNIILNLKAGVEVKENGDGTARQASYSLLTKEIMRLSWMVSIDYSHSETSIAVFPITRRLKWPSSRSIMRPTSLSVRCLFRSM